jgi:hypothetical protein
LAKTRGIYTTLDFDQSTLELPNQSYIYHNYFGANEMPATVVVGIGQIVQDQYLSHSFVLELSESANEKILAAWPGIAFAGKANVLSLPIQKSGDYCLSLLVGDSLLDHWEFHIDRNFTNNSDSNTSLPIMMYSTVFSELNDTRSLVPNINQPKEITKTPPPPIPPSYYPAR